MKKQKFYWVTTKENGEIRSCAHYPTLIHAINNAIKWGDVTERLPKRGIVLALHNQGKIYDTNKIKIEIRDYI